MIKLVSTKKHAHVERRAKHELIQKKRTWPTACPYASGHEAVKQKERRVDALALRADERRDKLR